MQDAHDMTQEHRESLGYPVSVQVLRPADADQGQLLLRMLIYLALGVGHHSLGGIFLALYVLVPAIAGVLLSRAPGPGFAAADRSRLHNALEWVLASYAYLLLVTDRFPTDADSRGLRWTVHSEGQPTLMSAALRALKSLPQAAWLFALGIAASVCAIVIGVHMWLGKVPPVGLCQFQRDFIGCLARFLAYHASLVDEYPPWSLNVDHEPTDTQELG